METREQLSVVLSNRPGELGQLCDRLREHQVNILAMDIQNSRDYMETLYRARERSGRRVALEHSYKSVIEESSKFSVIRLVVDKTDVATEVLRGGDYHVEVETVICINLTNDPGDLGHIAKKLATAGININYTYGSVFEDARNAFFIFHLADIEKAIEALK